MRNTEEKPPAYTYIEKTFLPNDDVLNHVAARAREFSKEGMSISSVEAQILQFLIRSLGIKSILEVGTFMGYSAIQMARSLPSDGKLISLEAHESYYEAAKENVDSSDVASKIEIVFGKAQDSLEKLAGPFDMIFIDADKGAYCQYLDWAEKNIRKGGLIVGDNTFLFGAVFEDEKPTKESLNRWQTMRTFNERLSDRSKYIPMCVPTGEGMTVAVKDF